MKITGATIEASGVTMALDKIRLKHAFMTEALPQLLNEKADGLSEDAKQGIHFIMLDIEEEMQLIIDHLEGDQPTKLKASEN